MSTKTTTKQAQPALGAHDEESKTTMHRKDVKPSARTLEEMKSAAMHTDQPFDDEDAPELQVHDVASAINKPAAGVIYALRVLDPSGAGVLGVPGSDVAEKDVGWLRAQIQAHLAKIGPHPPDAEKRELNIYQRWGEWIQDDVKLVKIPGDSIHFTLYLPHGSSEYIINLRFLPPHMQDRILAVPVRDENTILQVKTKVAAKYGIPAIDQRYLFGGRVLDDDRTLGALKIPAEATIELDVLNL